MTAAPVTALMAAVAERVDQWRGFPLGAASTAWAGPGIYAPTREGERPVSDTTALLLRHWFRAAPHDIVSAGGIGRFRYWPHQRRFVESVIYVHEVLGVRSVDSLYDALAIERSFAAFDPWPKLGGQLATGSGKTKVMSLLIGWTTLNATREGPDHLGIGAQVVVVAPGLFVKERLLFDFSPADKASVFRADPVVPPELERDWRLNVYGPDTTPMRLDPREPALIVTNVHRLMRTEDPPPEWPTFGRQERLMFDTPDPKKLEAETTPLLSRFRRGPGLLVINDEAHHVGDEPAHQKFEEKARNKKGAGIDASEDMAWIRSLRSLHARAGLGLQIDLSATLFEEAGGARKAKATRSTAPPPFRHTVVDYPLRDAISDGVVKHPILERIQVKGGGVEEEAVRSNQPNAWLTYEPLLRAGIGRWAKVEQQLRAEGDRRKPILFLLAEDRVAAQEIANFLTYGEASGEDLSTTRSVTGFVEPDTGRVLFAEPDEGGALRSTVIQIHVGAKENANEAEWEKVRARINAVDHDEVPNPRATEPGQSAMIPNPFNVVVSVMMLREGWDVRNVKVIVPLRACDSRTLAEQTLGRGLRRMHAPELDDNGAVTTVREELYVMQHPSFEAIIDEIKDIVEVRSSEELDHPPEYVRIEPREPAEERREVDVRLVRFLGDRERVSDWVSTFKAEPLPAHDRVDWQDDFNDREVETWLRGMNAQEDVAGQRFTLSAAPPFHEYDKLLEQVYVEPLLRDLQVAFSHKNAIKSIVIEFHRRSTFRLGRGQFLDFSAMIAEGGESARSAVCNLLRPEVIERVRDALRQPLREALNGRQTDRVPELHERRSADLLAYAARKQFELDRTGRSAFRNGAFDSEDELRFAVMVDRCPDVLGWVYNHRQGVGYAIEYDWQGELSRYFADFVVRVRWGDRIHNLIVEVKGRMDERDEAKARAGRRYAALLSSRDREPWHFLLVREDPKVGRADLAWFESLAFPRLAALLLHAEGISPEDEQTAMTWRLLTRDGIARRIEEFAAADAGLNYADLVKLADRGEADRDRLLVVAEALVTDRHPRLRRLFVDRRTSQTLSDGEVSRLFKLRAEGDDSALEAIDVVYVPLGGRP